MYIRYVSVRLLYTLDLLMIIAVCQIHAKKYFIIIGVYLVENHEGWSLNLVEILEVLSSLGQCVQADVEIWGWRESYIVSSEANYCKGFLFLLTDPYSKRHHYRF